MIIFVAGMSRSGSMWTFNITRELIRKSGRIPLPEVIPPNEASVITKAVTGVTKENEMYCIKTHLLLRPNLPNAKIICTYRDVREAMVSYMQFMHCDFKRGLEAARSMMSVIDYYFVEHKKNIVRIRYDLIMSEPVEVVREISAFLGFDLPSADMQLIAEQFSRERVSKFIDSLNSVEIAGNGMICDPALRENLEAISNLDGSFRVYDKRNAFQSHHITNSGEKWRTLLSKEQQAQVMAMAKEWLVKYGFPL